MPGLLPFLIKKNISNLILCNFGRFFAYICVAINRKVAIKFARFIFFFLATFPKYKKITFADKYMQGVLSTKVLPKVINRDDHPFYLLNRHAANLNKLITSNCW